MRRTRHGAGFTLLEMLVVISIMGVTATLGTVMFSRINTVWSETRMRSELDARADRAFETMRRDFAAVVSPRLTGVPLRGIAADADNPRFWGINLANDSVVIPAALPTPDGGTALGAVAYSLREGAEGSIQLTRATGPLADAAPSGAPTAVAKDALQLRIEYGTPSGEWQVGWAESTLPSAVRVNITFAHPTRKELQVSRKAVFPLHVN